MSAKRHRNCCLWRIILFTHMINDVVTQTAVTSATTATTGGPYIMIKPGNQTVLQGQRVNFPCGTEGYPSMIVHTWFKDMVDIRTTDGFRAGRITILQEGNLLIKTAVKSDRGWYMCRASNGLGHDEATAYLNVVYKPEVLSLPSQLIWAKGYRQQIDCPVDSNPPLHHIIWVKDQSTVQSTGRFDVLDNGTLLVSDVKEEDAGSYRCTPENAMGQGLSSNRVQVTVKDPPQITVSPLPLYIRNVGDSVTMNCEATGTPAVSLQWTKVGGTLDVSTNRITITDKYLQIKNLTKEDHGKYECRAINTIATILSPTELRIDNTTPHAPFNVRVVPGLFNITILWEPAYDGGTPQHYVLWFRQVSNYEWRTIAIPSEEATYFNLYSLQPDTEYEFKILSRNSFGNGSFSEVVRKRTLGYSPDAVKVLPRGKDGKEYIPEVIENHGPEPSTPWNLTARVKDGNILLRWNISPNPHLPIFLYKIEYKLDGSKKLFNVSGTENSAVIPDAAPGSYEIYIRSCGVLACSPWSNVTHVHISRDDVVIPQAMVGGIIGGVLFLLVAVLLALVAVFYSRRKERKAKEKKYDDVNYGKPDEMNGRHHESTSKRDRWQHNGGGDLVTSLNNTDSIFFLPQSRSFDQSASMMRPLILLDNKHDSDNLNDLRAETDGRGYDSRYNRQVPFTNELSFMSDRSQPGSIKLKPDYIGQDVKNMTWPNQHRDSRFEQQPLLRSLHPSYGQVLDSYIHTYPHPQEYQQHSSIPQHHPPLFKSYSAPSHHLDKVRQFPSQYQSHSNHLPSSYSHPVYLKSHPSSPQEILPDPTVTSRQQPPPHHNEEYPSFFSEDDDVFSSLPQPSGHHQIPGFPRQSSMKPSLKTYLTDGDGGLHPDSIFGLKDISSVLDQSSEQPPHLQTNESQNNMPAAIHPLNRSNTEARANIPGYYINTGDITKPFAMVSPNEIQFTSPEAIDGSDWPQGVINQVEPGTSSQQPPSTLFRHPNISGFSDPFPQSRTNLFDSSSHFSHSHSNLRLPANYDTLERDKNEDSLEHRKAPYYTHEHTTEPFYNNEPPRPRAHSEGSKTRKQLPYSADDYYNIHENFSGGERPPYNSVSYPDMSLPHYEKPSSSREQNKHFPYRDSDDHGHYLRPMYDNQPPTLKPGHHHSHQPTSSSHRDITMDTFHQRSPESRPQRYAPRTTHPGSQAAPKHGYLGSQNGDDTIPAESGSHSSGIGSRNTSQSTSSYRPHHQGSGGKGSASFSSGQGHDLSSEVSGGQGVSQPIHRRDASADENYEFDSLNALENDIMDDLRRYSQLSGGSGNASFNRGSSPPDFSAPHAQKPRHYPDSERRFEKLREEFKQYRQHRYYPSDDLFQLPPTASAALPIGMNGEPLYPMDSEML